MLINSDVEIVEIEDDFIRNINTPEAFEDAKKEIQELKWNQQKINFLNVNSPYKK